MQSEYAVIVRLIVHDLVVVSSKLIANKRQLLVAGNLLLGVVAGSSTYTIFVAVHNFLQYRSKRWIFLKDGQDLY